MTIRHTGWLAIVVLAVGTSVAAAKSPPDMTPQFDTPEYWDGHAILHGEVRYYSDNDHPTVQVLDQFSGNDKADATIAVDPKKVWLEPHQQELERTPIKLENYDRVFVALAPKAEFASVVVYRPPSNDISLALAESCRVIQEIRAKWDADAGLERAVNAGDAVAERYVFRMLLANDAGKMAGKTTETVRGIRADPAVDIKTRLLANDLLAHRAVAKGEKGDDWDWTTGVLRQEIAQDMDTMRALMRHLEVDLRDDRLRTIDLICELASDKEGPSRRRAAALISGNIENVLGSGDKDAANEKLVKLCIALLADETPMVRTSAADALWRISYRLTAQKSAADWTPLVKDAVAALRKAEATEVGDDMKVWMSQSRTMIGAMVGDK